MNARLLMTVCVGLVATCAGAQELSEESFEVWEAEKAYYQYAAANDPQGYLSLFDENVIGWPTFDPQPKGKDRVSQWIAMVHANPAELWRYEIERLAIQSHGNVVVVHYRLREWFESAESGEELRPQEFRITHTWMRRDGAWKIIAGMGGIFN